MDKNIQDFVTELLKKAEEAGFIEAEAVYGADSTMSVSAREGKIVEYENNESSSLSFRGLFNGQMGYASTEDIRPEMIPFLLEQAKDNCSVLEVKEKITVYEGEKEYPEFNGFFEELTSIDYDYLANTALSLEQALLAYDSRIEAVDDCFAVYGSAEIMIRNSKGMHCESRTNGFDVYIGCRAKEGEDVQTYGKGWSFTDLSQFNIQECVNKVGRRVIDKLGAKPVPSAKLPVVLDKVAARALLASFAGSFSAEAIQKGISRLVGKLGEVIADSKITLIDEGMIEGSALCMPFDSEGVSAKRTVLIDKGRFTSELHNRKTALVDGVESTGNATGGTKGPLGIAPTNLYFEKGQYTQDELFEKMGNGIYITAVYGLHAGINAISGDFSLMSEGFLIENGKIGKPVNQITIVDNFFDVLMKVEALANDVDYTTPESTHIQSPSLLIPDVSVAGE